jgi:hypothetical protein
LANARTAKKPRKEPDKSFVFRDVINLIKATGFKASTLGELRDCIARVSEDCVFHHTYQYFLKGHIQEHTNDFGVWASESLEERALAEYLSNIDPYSFKSVEGLRRELLRVIDYYTANFPEPREVLTGDEFYFNETVSFVFPAGIKARNLAEFLMAVKHVDLSSIYYHFYEARVRLRKKADDFSKWVDEVVRAPGMARSIRAIDPFMHNIDGIREHIIQILEEGLGREMEVLE